MGNRAEGNLIIPLCYVSGRKNRDRLFYPGTVFLLKRLHNVDYQMATTNGMASLK